MRTINRFTPRGHTSSHHYRDLQTGGRLSEILLRRNAPRLQADGAEAAEAPKETENGTQVGIYPLQILSGKMTLEDKDGIILSLNYENFRAGVPFRRTYNLQGELSAIRLEGKLLYSSDDQVTDRPERINPKFDLGSAEGLAAHGAYLFGMREYPLAEEKIDRALAEDPSNIQALNIKTMLLTRRMDYEGAYACANNVLAIDEYEPWANYNSGLIAVRMGKDNDAMDRFEIAAITQELRSAACTQLAKIHFRRGDTELAEDYLCKSLRGNSDNVTALEQLYQITHDESLLERISSLDPLCHFPDMERVLAGKMSPVALDASIGEELKLQNYFEYAAFYISLGMKDKALSALDAAKQDNVLVSLWKAWLEDGASLIAEAETGDMAFVFPYRECSADVLAWVVANGGSWKSKYLLAMLKDSLGDKDGARALMGDNPDYASYYAYRFTLDGDRADIEKAFELDPGQWRFRNNLARQFYDEGNYKKAIELTGKFYEKNPDNFHVDDTYAKSLIADGQYEKAEKVLAKIRILPFEGQSGSRALYRNTKLQLAAAQADKGNVKAALAIVQQARMWPENLGVGRPYDDLVDERTEDWLSAVLYKRLGDTSKAEEYLSRLTEKDPGNDWKHCIRKLLQKLERSGPRFRNM